VGEPRFEIPDCELSAVRRLRVALGVSDTLAQVLVRRGLQEPERARAFLDAEESHSYTAFAGIDRAIAAIRRHVEAGTRITVHGDYDVDGVCSTAVLVRALRRLGADVDWYLPDRQSDGYGLNADTVARLAARGTRLLVTADCAITAVEEVAAARAQGIDVVVTDHHSVRADGALPDAPIVHPAVCGYPCAELCATAVAYKLAEGLTEREPSEDLDLVALATIADVVALLGENRTLVKRGLRALAGTVKPGLRALMAVARVDPARVNERTVAFGLAPRINAAGRLYRADAGLELILTEDPIRAAQVAQELDRVNHERRAAERAIRFQAEAQIAELSAARGEAGLPRALVLAGEDWHVGVVGIVASRLAETHHRPVVLIALDGPSGRGSGRSGCAAFDLLGGLNACAEHLSGHGGHRAAAGLEIERARVDAFAEALHAHAQSVLDEADAAPLERVDAVLDGSELGIALAEELQALAPFGQGNRPVSLMLEDATFADVKPMGEGKHARFTVRARAGNARAVAFNTGGQLAVSEGEPAQATFALEINEWNGMSEPRLVLRHARRAQAPEYSGPHETEAGELLLFAA
jgi:single-stranded-DNA-specific exonuclease